MPPTAGSTSGADGVCAVGSTDQNFVAGPPTTAVAAAATMALATNELSVVEEEDPKVTAASACDDVAAKYATSSSMPSCRRDIFLFCARCAPAWLSGLQSKHKLGNEKKTPCSQRMRIDTAMKHQPQLRIKCFEKYCMYT
jgi:hypothetical protein